VVVVRPIQWTGNGEMGKWGNGEISTKTLTP
jgi:hypothetical protein